MKKLEILGIDIGNTIIDGSLADKPAYPDAVRVIRRLLSERFSPERTHLISKVNEEQHARVVRWLQDNDFFAVTGLLPENLHFCPERADKAAICDRLGVTHHIDDRPEVHYHLQGIVEHRYMFRHGLNTDSPDPDFLKEREGFMERLTGVELVTSWKKVEEILLPFRLASE
ncbi:MAG TPA: hypothetical protein VGE62_00885 [Candidatus Paceibacterota bacterium]